MPKNSQSSLRFCIVVALTAAAPLASGCQLVAGLGGEAPKDETGGGGSGGTATGGGGSGGTATGGTGGTTGTAGQGGTGGGPAQCDTAASQVCAPPPGAGWSAPFALAPEAAGCGEQFGPELGSLYNGFDANPAVCDCKCGTPTVNCSTSMSAVGYSGPNCTVGEGSNSISQNQCYSQVLAYTHSLTLDTPTSSCAVGNVTKSIPKPTWTTADVACAAQKVDAVCPNPEDACLPVPVSPFTGDLCVMRDGADTECPAGYPSKTVYYTDYTDTRDCPDSCTCTAQGASCKVAVARYTGKDCGGNQVIPSTTVNSGGAACIISGTVVSMKPGNVTLGSSGMCAPGTANPSGMGTPTGATTVCCL
ncbi:MAG: hypothetical protein R3B70_09505 [Polyangiaceae bacterium]